MRVSEHNSTLVICNTGIYMCFVQCVNVLTSECVKFVQLESVRCINRVTMSDGACVSSLPRRLGRTG